MEGDKLDAASIGTDQEHEESKQFNQPTIYQKNLQEELSSIAQILVELSSVTVDQGAGGDCKPDKEMDAVEKADACIKAEGESTLAGAAAMDQGANQLQIEELVWCDVGIIKETSCLVRDYYMPGSNNDPEHENLTLDNVPDYSNMTKVALEPGTAYKFRVAAINSCGRGPWSEVSEVKTLLPVSPGIPSLIKLSISSLGAHLSWQPPSNPAGTKTEYAVLLAVESGIDKQTGKSPELTFARVYNGPQTQTLISNKTLAAAHIDTTSKPAIIFRIAAKNENGYGQAIQVRWLQDVVTSPGGDLKTTPKKERL